MTSRPDFDPHDEPEPAGTPDHLPAWLNPAGALGELGALWSDDFDAYARGDLPIEQVHCVLCQCAPCRCPAFGTPEYFALLDFRHGRGKGTDAR